MGGQVGLMLCRKAMPVIQPRLTSEPVNKTKTPAVLAIHLGHWKKAAMFLGVPRSPLRDAVIYDDNRIPTSALCPGKHRCLLFFKTDRSRVPMGVEAFDLAERLDEGE